MHRSIAALLLLPFVLGSGAPAALAQGDEVVEAARGATLRIGQALRNADVPSLRPHLPERGKIQLHLELLGPADGFFSSGQVEALLGGFLERGEVRSFDLLGVEHQDGRYALTRGRAAITDRNGRPARIDLQLAFELEGDRWVLREIRETRP